MRRLEKNLTLFESAPNLVKEWHPTANGDLTPMNVKFSHRKMIWWICNDGHEWKATIKNRINGGECPNCGGDIEKSISSHNQSVSRKKSTKIQSKKNITKQGALLESDIEDPSLGRNFRKTKRYKVEALANVEIPLTGHWFYAGLKNFSSGGLYFETDSLIPPGTSVKINLDRPLFQSDQKSHDLTIRWCRKLEEDDKSLFNYGIGSKFI